MLLAFLAVFMPTDWMAQTHSALGLGELPRDPVFQYLSRSISALYGIHGGLLILFAADLGRYLPAVRYVSAMNVVLGLLILGIDLKSGLPAMWAAVEGPGITVSGAVLLWLCSGVRERGAP